MDDESGSGGDLYRAIMRAMTDPNPPKEDVLIVTGIPRDELDRALTVAGRIVGPEALHARDLALIRLALSDLASNRAEVFLVDGDHVFDVELATEDAWRRLLAFHAAYSR